MGICIFCAPFQHHGSWRKASKCKKLIEQVQLRLKLLQARKNAIIAQTSEDIAKLLQDGYFQKAFYMVENLYKDKCRASAYELIAKICDCISNNLPGIAKKRGSLEVHVAVSSLAFAAARCGELPELVKLRSLLQDWYGNEFDTGNVKSELKNTFCAGSISEEMKLELIQEIAKDYSAHLNLPGQDEHESYKIEKSLPKPGKKPTPCFTSNMANNFCNEICVIEDVSSREPTENLREIQEKDIDVQPMSYKGGNKRTPFCCDTESYQPLPQESSKKNDKAMGSRRGGKKHGLQRNRTRSLTDLVEGEGRNDNNSELKHVHPKLPYYEDIEATFKKRTARKGISR